ncbi:MAG TPA: DoxX family protein [Actinomycetota bacterium]
MSDAASVLVLVARIVIGFYFSIFAGILGHIMASKGMEGYASAMRFPVPGIAGWPTGIWLMLGGISVALGIYGDIGSLMIIAFLVLAAAWFHRFWQVGEDMKLMQTGFFWRNVLTSAGLLVLFALFAELGPEMPYTITDSLISF